jgi:hypothetical protein
MTQEEQYVRERLLDLTSCYGRPRLWESIAKALAVKENKAVLRKFVLEDTSMNVQCMAARMYARLRGDSPIEGDPVLTHLSASIRDCTLEGAADVGDKDLIRYYESDRDAEIAAAAQDYLEL